jgi:hypothetical protein
MRTNYYYLISSLPTLSFGDFEQVPVEELMTKIMDNLTPEDQRRAEYLRKARDIRNLHSAAEEWQTFRSLGNIPPEDFSNPEVELELPEDWNIYILSQKGEKPVSIDKVWLDYFEVDRTIGSEFIQAWNANEIGLRTALALIRQEQQKNFTEKNISSEVESDENPIIQEFLQNSRLPNFGMSYRFDWADNIREIIANNNPKDAELAIDQIRWEFLDNWIANRHFANDVILAYINKLLICEQWKRLDQQKGKDIIHTILGGISGE